MMNSVNEINIYCDESSHLLGDSSNVMVIGCVHVSKNKVSEINKRIRSIKERNGINIESELKWVSIRESKVQVYLDLVDYFFDDDDLNSRIVIIPNKSGLIHEKYQQTHDDWYYKMYYTLLNVLFSPGFRYNIYMDIKDTNSHWKTQKLLDILRNKVYDYSGNTVKKIQPVRSHEVEIMQIVDVIIGAVGYENRNLSSSRAKLRVLEKIKEKSKINLKRSTLYGEKKLNVFVWDIAGDGRGL